MSIKLDTLEKLKNSYSEGEKHSTVHKGLLETQIFGKMESNEFAMLVSC